MIGRKYIRVTGDRCTPHHVIALDAIARIEILVDDAWHVDKHGVSLRMNTGEVLEFFDEDKAQEILMQLLDYGVIYTVK